MEVVEAIQTRQQEEDTGEDHNEQEHSNQINQNDGMQQQHVVDLTQGSQNHQDSNVIAAQDEAISELYIWGNDYFGQLGVGNEKVIHNLPKVCSFNIVVSEVSCGEEHTVFVQADGGYVYAMGSNAEGRLGVANPQMRSCNVPTLVEGICNIAKVSCGAAHTLALGEDGQAYAWGQAFYGALGLGLQSIDDRSATSDLNTQNQRAESESNQLSAIAQGLENAFSPQAIGLEVFDGVQVLDVEAGGRHSIFVTRDHRVFGCGDANQGQLGLGDELRDRVKVPTQILHLEGFEIRQVACGKYHTLFLVDVPAENGSEAQEEFARELWACGANNCGQVGNDSKQNQFVPVRIDPRAPEKSSNGQMVRKGRSHNFKQVSAWNCSAAVTEEGIMYVWGSGVFGEFKKPRKVKLQNNILVSQLTVGGSFMALIDHDNRIVVWGSNSNGEIGVGDQKLRNHPTRLETIEDKLIHKVSVGNNFAFAIGRTTSKVENSIFADENGEKSQISAIQDPPSQVMDPENFNDPENQPQVLMSNNAAIAKEVDFTELNPSDIIAVQKRVDSTEDRKGNKSMDLEEQLDKFNQKETPDRNNHPQATNKDVQQEDIADNNQREKGGMVLSSDHDENMKTNNDLSQSQTRVVDNNDSSSYNRRFEQAASNVHISHSSDLRSANRNAERIQTSAGRNQAESVPDQQNQIITTTSPKSNCSALNQQNDFEKDARIRSLEEQVESLKAMIEDKEAQLSQVSEQSQIRSAEYQEKLAKFKNLQDQELKMTKDVRAENKQLKDENQKLKDDLFAIQQDRKRESMQKPPPIPTTYSNQQDLNKEVVRVADKQYHPTQYGSLGRGGETTSAHLINSDYRASVSPVQSKSNSTRMNVEEMAKDYLKNGPFQKASYNSRRSEEDQDQFGQARDSFGYKGPAISSSQNAPPAINGSSRGYETFSNQNQNQDEKQRPSKVEQNKSSQNYRPMSASYGGHSLQNRAGAPGSSSQNLHSDSKPKFSYNSGYPDKRSGVIADENKYSTHFDKNQNGPDFVQNSSEQQLNERKSVPEASRSYIPMSQQYANNNTCEQQQPSNNATYDRHISITNEKSPDEKYTSQIHARNFSLNTAVGDTFRAGGSAQPNYAKNDNYGRSAPHVTEKQHQLQQQAHEENQELSESQKKQFNGRHSVGYSSGRVDVLRNQGSDKKSTIFTQPTNGQSSAQHSLLHRESYVSNYENQYKRSGNNTTIGQTKDENPSQYQSQLSAKPPMPSSNSQNLQSSLPNGMPLASEVQARLDRASRYTIERSPDRNRRAVTPTYSKLLAENGIQDSQNTLNNKNVNEASRRSYRPLESRKEINTNSEQGQNEKQRIGNGEMILRQGSSELQQSRLERITTRKFTSDFQQSNGSGKKSAQHEDQNHTLHERNASDNQRQSYNPAPKDYQFGGSQSYQPRDSKNYDRFSNTHKGVNSIPTEIGGEFHRERSTLTDFTQKYQNQPTMGQNNLTSEQTTQLTEMGDHMKTRFEQIQTRQAHGRYSSSFGGNQPPQSIISHQNHLQTEVDHSFKNDYLRPSANAGEDNSNSQQLQKRSGEKSDISGGGNEIIQFSNSATENMYDGVPPSNHSQNLNATKQQDQGSKERLVPAAARQSYQPLYTRLSEDQTQFGGSSWNKASSGGSRQQNNDGGSNKKPDFYSKYVSSQQQPVTSTTQNQQSSASQKKPLFDNPQVDRKQPPTAEFQPSSLADRFEYQQRFSKTSGVTAGGSNGVEQRLSTGEPRSHSAVSNGADFQRYQEFQQVGKKSYMGGERASANPSTDQRSSFNGSQTIQRKSFDNVTGVVGNGDRGEDIKSKLARYRQERENFEAVRMQFRQKNQELARKDFKPASFDKTEEPYQNMGGSTEYRDQQAISSAGTSKENNIFAVDQNSRGFRESPAFGKDDVPQNSTQQNAYNAPSVYSLTGADLS